MTERQETEQGPSQERVLAGVHSYSKRMLAVYDLWILGVVCPAVWHCSRRRMAQQYDRNVGVRHLDIGPGTGYFLRRCTMQIEILGSLTATANGNTFIPSAMKPRQLLALLIANSNRYVPPSAITKELWGTTPPRSAANTVQTYVMQIRKLLEPALTGGEGVHATDVLVTGAGGYQFSVDPADIDLTRYLDLTAEGESALLNKEYVRAAHAFADALAVWRDNALCNVRPGPMLDTFVRELEDSHTITLERRIEAELCLGQHYGVLRELTELTRNHPLNENLHSQFILALYRTGRRVQALKVYQKLRKRMTDELGLDPSPRLQQLQTAVLNCDHSLEFEHKSRLFSPEIVPTH